jgi:uncharacterized lipoprotein YajG
MTKLITLLLAAVLILPGCDTPQPSSIIVNFKGTINPVPLVQITASPVDKDLTNE